MRRSSFRRKPKGGPVRNSTLQPISDKRRDELDDRAKTRRVVLRRANYRCEYADLVPEVSCAFYPDREDLEVDELRGGSYRCSEWLDPDQCRAACPAHHDWKTNHKAELLARLFPEGVPDL